MPHRNRWAVVLLLACGLPACVKTSQPIPAQRWGSTTVKMETHPSPPIVGMNEILIIASKPGGMPAFDMVVSLRSDPTRPWRQAIQDGNVGVFRRAIAVKQLPATVEVELKHKQQAHVLTFALAP